MSKANQIRQKAQEFLSKGHIDKAIQEYRRLITIESKNPNLYNELGDIYLRAGDKAQAVQNFEKAATIYEKVALYNNAVAVCKKIMRVDPEKIDTMFRLGELRAKQKLTGEAATFFTQYVEAVFENPQANLQRSQRDVDLMLELVPSNGAILAKAVEVYEQLGMKLKAIEIYRTLITLAAGDGDSKQQTLYARKVEEIKATLSSAELEKLPAAGSAEGAAPAAPAAGEAPAAPGDASADASADAQGETPTVDRDSAAAEAPPVESRPGSPGAGESPSAADDGAGGPKRTETDAETGVDEAVEEAEMVAAMSQGRGPVSQGGPYVDRRKPPVETPPAAAEKAPSAETQTPRPEESIVSFAPIGPGQGETLADEITSDVEKDDLRSHYDLGMAYLEMGLFNEAIREYQIASRAQEFQLSSMEMIGYCFLKSDQPRLAVKQLTRALEIEKATGAGSIGIHYNIAVAYEMLGELETAREHFEEVYVMDMSFRDVAEKMKKFSAVS